MQSSEILDQLTVICRDLFDDQSLKLTEATTAADVPAWDSFNHINLLVAVEAHFGIRLSSSEIESLSSVGRLVNVIGAKLGRP